MDKVQKIREEVERLKKRAEHNFDDISLTENERQFCLCELNVLTLIGKYIDSLQEEPVDKCKGCNNVKGCITCVDGDQWAHYKESESEDLEEAAEDYDIRQGAELKPFAIKYFKAGAKWQKERDKETIELAEDHAMLAGMNKMKEEMMSKAIDASCFGFQDAALFSFRLPADKYLVGSEVKVIVIKED